MKSPPTLQGSKTIGKSTHKHHGHGHHGHHHGGGKSDSDENTVEVRNHDSEHPENLLRKWDSVERRTLNSNEFRNQLKNKYF